MNVKLIDLVSREGLERAIHDELDRFVKEGRTFTVVNRGGVYYLEMVDADGSNGWPLSTFFHDVLNRALKRSRRWRNV
jgi:hypothetical protein